MHLIIKKIIKQRGIDVLYSKTLISCMDDEGAFSDIEMRPYKKILRTIVTEDYSQKLTEIGEWNAETEALAHSFAQRNMLQEDEILYVFSCLAYGLGWLKKSPKLPAETKKIRQQEAQKKAKEAEAAQKANEEAIRQKAEETARKKAEAAEKRAKDAERRAAAAEADKQAADVVITMIKNIGTIECTEDCINKVRAALLAYNSLNSAQKSIVDSCIGDTLQRMADETKRIAAGVAQKKAEEEKARKKAEQDAKDQEIEAILLAYCKKKGSSLTNSSHDHAEYDMPRKKYDEIYEYVLRKNKQQRNFSISLDGYDYFFYAAPNNKSFGISAWRKINEDGLWNQNDKKNTIGRIDKIFKIVLIVIWSIFLIVNAIYTWMVNSWLSCIIWAVITFAVFMGILSLMNKAEEEHPINLDSPDAGSIAHLLWRICWTLGLSIICEIIMIVIFIM